MADTDNKEVARITFVFETICSVNCELYFMVVCFPFFACDGVPRKGYWEGWAPRPHWCINVTDRPAHSDFNRGGAQTVRQGLPRSA